jgi:alpha-tubulin suppressor-like RCC1 family protein
MPLRALTLVAAIVLGDGVSACDTGAAAGSGRGVRFGSVVAGYEFTCALTDDAQTYCWGATTFLQDSIPHRLPTPEPLVASSTSVGSFSQQLCGLSATGRIYCWGTYIGGSDGSAWYGDMTSPVGMVDSVRFLSVTAARGHACGLAVDSTAWCWGSHSSGKRGQNGPYSIGTLPGQSGYVDLNANRVYGGSHFSRLAGGDWVTCGIRGDRHVACWGDSVVVGNPTVAFEHDPALCWPASACAMAPGDVEGLTGTADLAAGEAHACAITPTGVLCWGNDYYGQLGGPGAGQDSRAVTVTLPAGSHGLVAGGFHSCTLTPTGQAYCWGSNEKGQLGAPMASDPSPPVPVDAGGLRFTVLAAGYSHTCGLTCWGLIFCWGDNGAGELGIGNRTPSTTPVAVASPRP